MGAGRAGHALAGALGASGIEVDGPYGRSAGGPPASIAEAGVVLVAVGDRDLPTALGQLRGFPLAAGAVVLHTSGSSDPAGALDALRAKGHPAGTFHPLVPLTGVIRELTGVWIGVDGDAEAVAAGRGMAEVLGARVLPIPPGAKARYHTAAVLASNFPVVLAELAMRQMRAAGVGAEEARGAVMGLMAAAVANLQSLDPGRALTGPVARGDAATIARHLAVLESDPEALAVYMAMTQAALTTVSGIDPARLAEIRAVLTCDAEM